MHALRPISSTCLGLLAVFWCIFWFWLVTDSPFDHPTITDEELNYLSEELADDKAEKQVWIALGLLSTDRSKLN